MKQQNAITITQDELLKALFETVYKRRRLCASHVVHGIAAGTFKLLQKPRKCTTDHVPKSRTGTWNISDHCIECGGSGKHLQGCRLGSMLD